MKRVRSAAYLAWQRKTKAKQARERREYALARLGGRCARCGRTDNLHIDHIDKATKLFPISRPPSQAAFLLELEKCQLLCEDHHRAKSAAEISGEAAPSAKLTLTQVREIRHRLAAGAVGRALAREYGVGPMEISRIKNGKRWWRAA
jgi:5-methylcytosine-specific restriction endonuclease McrA